MFLLIKSKEVEIVESKGAIACDILPVVMFVVGQTDTLLCV